ncbi:hypothetical protein EV356DRAFT_508717 [Viridothelium virens]|uniref:Apoptosis regulator Bcl-2 family BH4 domain-containing protein n=1 Tax=Viridothelium virens TaxID=1048519 RepID=A0A6A6HJT9_VIRVR|nr:hypothetical protein EV356DRAFT_508717 [Viridothelium virens]
MFASFSIPFGLPKIWVGGNRGRGINIPSVEIHSVETAADKRARSLKHLLKANHTNHSIIYHNLRFHNHAPHILGSAYILGASPEQLNTIYDTESKVLEPWHDSPGEIINEDWRDFLGQRDYQRAYIDFFEDQLVQKGYDWKRLVEDFLFQGKEPLINNVIGGLAHPLIHLGYGYELKSGTVAIEALALTSCFYDFQHKYLDDPSYTRRASYSTTSVLEALDRIAADQRFDGVFEEQGSTEPDPLFEKKEDIVLDHWNAWRIEKPEKQFEESQRAAVALLVATDQRDSKYDFFLVHVLTSSHAIRILLPLIPAKYHLSLVRQWWLFAISVYVQQLRLPIQLERIENYNLNGRDWKFVDDQAINSKWATDAHFVKGLRAMKEAAKTWGDDTNFYLKAAVKFADEFDDWGGFGAVSFQEMKA